MTSLEKKIIDYVEANKEDLYKELSYLLRFDSTNYITWGKEHECAEYIADEYRKLGLEPDLYCLNIFLVAAQISGQMSQLS